MGSGSVKLLDLNQVITVLNQNVTESNFTNSCLVTFQNTVISAAQTPQKAEISLLY